MQSHTVEISPCDSRCRYWAKVVRAQGALPQPAACTSAHDIPGPFRQRGEEELLPGDVLFEGEANHHRRTDRGWSYWVTVVDNNGELARAKSGEFGELRKRMKAAGLSSELLMGSGDIAAMVRIAHAVRGRVLAASTVCPENYGARLGAGAACEGATTSQKAVCAFKPETDA